MSIGELLGVKQIKLKLNGNYDKIEELYDAIKDLPFEAGRPSLVKQISYLIAFPELDRNNQVQILGSKNKYVVTRSVQPAGFDKIAKNMVLENLTDGWSGLSGGMGKTKKRCMKLVEATAEVIHSSGI